MIVIRLVSITYQLLLDTYFKVLNKTTKKKSINPFCFQFILYSFQVFWIWVTKIRWPPSTRGFMVNVVPGHYIIYSGGRRATNGESESLIKCPLQKLQYFPPLCRIREVSCAGCSMVTLAWVWVLFLQGILKCNFFYFIIGAEYYCTVYALVNSPPELHLVCST